mgnify:CR=1 FL=1
MSSDCSVFVAAVSGSGDGVLTFSEAHLLELVVELLNRLVVHAAGLGCNLLLLKSVELLGVLAALVLELVDEASLGPSHLFGEISELAELAVSFQSKALEGLGNNNSLLVVVREGDTLEDLKAVKSSSTACLLVGEHGAEGLPEHAGGSSVMDEVLLGVSVTSLVDDLTLLKPVSEEGA